MLIALLLFSYVNSYKVPGSCGSEEYFEPSLLDCSPCLANASLVTSDDGFSCTCDERSVPVEVDRCRACNTTEVVSTDGTMCVPRRCQSSGSRISCRKCPNDYISVTQNFDGSPMKEVQCIKCARGYKAHNNVCVKCESCVCNRNEIIVKDKCISKKYVLDRPKYAENQLHPNELLEIVKMEYLCTQRDIRACRTLSGDCVRNFYITDPAGPCRLWIQNVTNYKDLPLLSIDDSKSKPKIFVKQGYDKLSLALAVHTKSGGFKLLRDSAPKSYNCFLPINIKIGYDILNFNHIKRYMRSYKKVQYILSDSIENTFDSPFFDEIHAYVRLDKSRYDCSRNISETKDDFGDIFELYLRAPSDEILYPLPVTVRKPNGYYVQKGTWPSSNFRKFFTIHSSLSTTTNISNIIYLQTLLIRIRVERVASSLGSLQLHIDVEAQYAMKSHLTDVVTTSLRVVHDMPSAGVLWRLEIWGGVLGSLMALYALVQWRGVVRRGGLHIVLLPLLASYIADGLYCATVIATLHALAAEAGTVDLTLPLSQTEEYVIQSFVYAVICLKTIKVIWMNWNQCRYDIFFMDWSKYNPPMTDTVSIQEKLNCWKEEMLAREWMSLQTVRRVSPGFTVTSTLLILHIIDIWNSHIPRGQGYKWVIATVVWWCSYIFLLCFGYLLDKFTDSRSKTLPKICSDLQLSLLVFQEEYYAHYVDGRNEDLIEFRSSTYSLQTCRIICSPQLRTVYQKLTVNGDFNDHDRNRDLLSKFLCAFFERALDGLNWVANERSMLERLLDVELIAREGGNTSVLLYDTNVNTPSCFAVTWLGEEWLLATFDSMLFGCVLIITGQPLTAALVSLVVWQIMKFIRTIFGSWNIKNKMGFRT